MRFWQIRCRAHSPNHDYPKRWWTIFDEMFMILLLWIVLKQSKMKLLYNRVTFFRLFAFHFIHNGNEPTEKYRIRLIWHFSPVNRSITHVNMSIDFRLCCEKQIAKYLDGQKKKKTSTPMNIVLIIFMCWNWISFNFCYCRTFQFTWKVIHRWYKIKSIASSCNMWLRVQHFFDSFFFSSLYIAHNTRTFIRCHDINIY